MIVLSHSHGAIPQSNIPALAREIVDNFAHHHVGPNLGQRLARVTVLKILDYPQDRLFVGGDRPPEPMYDFEIVIPEGTLNEATKENMARSLTEAVLRAEGTPWSTEASERVWCVFRVVPEGRWLSGDAVLTRKTILRRLLSGRGRFRDKSPDGRMRAAE